MTIVCALPDPGKGITWIGSDTLSESGNHTMDVGPKYMMAHGLALGYAGPLRGLNLIRANPDLLEKLNGPVDLTERLRTMFLEDGMKPSHKDSEDGFPYYGCQFLLANAGTCWEITGYFDIIECPAGKLAAIGNGMEHALGAAAMLARSIAPASMTPDKMMIGILQVAISLTPNCGGRYHITPLMTKEVKEAHDALEREQRAAAHEKGEQPEEAPPVGPNGEQSPAPG